MAYSIQVLSPLSSLVSSLRAVAQLHQSHHWQASGATYYGDHLLFERLYNAANEDVDAVAERAAGLNGSAHLDTRELAQGTLNHLKSLGDEPRGDNMRMMTLSLAAERALLDQIAQIKRMLTSTNRLTAGTSNLLDGIADRHEQSIYLLQQRLSRAPGM